LFVGSSARWFLRNITVSENTGQAPVIFHRHRSPFSTVHSSLTLDSSTIISNTLSSTLFDFTSVDDLMVSNCTFAKNIIDQGSLVEIDSFAVKLLDNTFVNNKGDHVLLSLDSSQIAVGPSVVLDTNLFLNNQGRINFLFLVISLLFLLFLCDLTFQFSFFVLFCFVVVQDFVLDLHHSSDPVDAVITNCHFADNLGGMSPLFVF
jgi:hypothetical protein